MRATIPFIQQKFNEYNAMIFKGSLPPVPIALSRARTSLGQCAYTKRRTILGEIEKYNFKLRISTAFDLPQEMLEDVIIHEMIHYYIDYNKIKDTSAHGRVFRQMMNDINSTFNRHITVSTRLNSEQKATGADTRKRYHVIAAVKLKDGRTGVKVLPRIWQRIYAYRDALLKSGRVESVTFYMSCNPFFNRYPNSSTFAVHYIDENILEKELKVNSEELIVKSGKLP